MNAWRYTGNWNNHRDTHKNTGEHKSHGIMLSSMDLQSIMTRIMMVISEAKSIHDYLLDINMV